MTYYDSSMVNYDSFISHYNSHMTCYRVVVRVVLLIIFELIKIVLNCKSVTMFSLTICISIHAWLILTHTKHWMICYNSFKPHQDAYITSYVSYMTHWWFTHYLLWITQVLWMTYFDSCSINHITYISNYNLCLTRAW